MRVGDLSSGASKLANALKQLNIKWEIASEGWHDVRAKAFHKDAIEPLTPSIKETLDSLGRLAEVLDRAIRDVSNSDGM
jgi:X-X-X-Leu-X-X-Gly heptad repeat protein